LNTSGEALLFWLQMFDPLIAFDEDLNLVPALATSWEFVDDTTLQLKLREGVKFHNGEEFNAEAVKVSLDRILNPDLSFAAKGRMPLLSQVDIVDDYTVNLICTEPCPLLPRGLQWGFIEAPKYLEENGDDYFGEHPVGTGPFKFVEWFEGDHITLEANEDYWRGRPNLDGLVIKIVPESSTQVAALKAGEAHVISSLPPDLVEAIDADPNTRVVSTLSSVSFQVNFYCYDWEGPETDKRVRQALNYAVDKETILNQLMRGYGAVLDGQIPTKGVVGYNPDLEPYPYDPEKAKQLLAEAGYPDGFETIVSTSFGRALMDEEVIQAVLEYWAQVGVKAKIENFEWGVFRSRRAARELPNFVTEWFNYGDGEFALAHARCDSGLGKYWCDETFDALIDKGRATVDEEARVKIYQEAVAYMREEAPVLFLTQSAVLWGVSDNIVDFKPRQDQRVVYWQTDLSQ